MLSTVFCFPCTGSAPLNPHLKLTFPVPPRAKAHQLASVCPYRVSPVPSHLIQHLLRARSSPGSPQASGIGSDVPILQMTKLRSREITSHSSTVTELIGGKSGIRPWGYGLQCLACAFQGAIFQMMCCITPGAGNST